MGGYFAWGILEVFVDWVETCDQADVVTVPCLRGLPEAKGFCVIQLLLVIVCWMLMLVGLIRKPLFFFTVDTSYYRAWPCDCCMLELLIWFC